LFKLGNPVEAAIKRDDPEILLELMKAGAEIDVRIKLLILAEKCVFRYRDCGFYETLTYFASLCILHLVMYFKYFTIS